MSNDMYIFVDYSIFMHPYPIRGGSKGWKIDQ
jgi:hypothetical protein